jgi:SAM-dependent methyltransferase
MLTPEREAAFATFIQDYTHIRHTEGRGSTNPVWYRSLPFAEGRFAPDWRIRAQSYRKLSRLISADHSLRIADLGAGNGWLSNRLAENGHHVAAVDLLTDALDGLGAYRHYGTTFEVVQADFDILPFTDASLDLIIFNGSFHYSTDAGATLHEALRTLPSDGHIAIVDTPVYHDASSGAKMVREREDHFERRYGTRSDALASENYLTYDRLDRLSTDLGLRWTIHTPFYGWRWHLRPLKARLRGHREPARFHVILGRRDA